MARTPGVWWLLGYMAQQGYAPARDMYNILSAGSNDTDDKLTVMTFTQMAAAATMGSTLANNYATPAQAPTDPQIVLMVNSLAANQQVLYAHIAPLLQQMAAISFNTQPPTLRCTFTVPHLMPFNVPPIHQLLISASSPFNAGGFNNGRGGRSTGGGVGVDMDSIVVSRLVLYRTKVLMYRTMVLLACLTKVRC
jgi:hypothetical protein